MKRAAPEDVTGQRFGMLTVLSMQTGGVSGRGARFVVRCDCGDVRNAPARNITRGITTSCGCKPRAARTRAASRVGQKFGALTILSLDQRHSSSWSVTVACDCGAKKSGLILTNVTSGMTRSCGCLADAARTTHGLSTTPAYHLWAGIVARCHPKTGHARYGKRGIRMCAGWSESPERFIADMGPRPSAEHSVDRRNNNRGYDCGKCADCIARDATANCRWATRSEQGRNTCRNVYLEWDGQRWLLSDLCKARGVSRQLMSLRVKHGWEILAAATTRPNPKFGGSGGFRNFSPERRREIAMSGHVARAALGHAYVPITSHIPHPRRRRPHRLITANGETRTLREWAALAGIATGTIRQRIARGISADAAVMGERTNAKRENAALIATQLAATGT